MSTLADETTAPLVKAMLIGDSKSGKTAALSSLVEAGFTLLRPRYRRQASALLLRTNIEEEGPKASRASEV